MKERRYDIDWLRIGVIFLLFPFHSARVFDIWEPNYVKSAVTSTGISMVVFFIGFWFMALMFLLAGMSAWYALKSRGPGQFARERVLRLLIPLVFGILVVVPPQGYMARLAQGYHDGYLHYLAGYFTDFSDLSGYTGSFTPAHLWFILYLFVLSLVALPIFLWVKRRLALQTQGGRPFALAGLMGKPLAVLLLFIPLTLTEALPDIGGKNPFFYLLLLLAGFLLVGSSGAVQAIDRLKKPALIALPFVVVLLSLMNLIWGFGSHDDFSAQQISMAFVRNLSLWLIILVLLGYGAKLINRPAKPLAYMSRAAFPVYILHQTVMMVWAYFVVRWGMPLWTQYFTIMLGSFVLTVGVYDLLVRRVAPLRVLFGVK